MDYSLARRRVTALAERQRSLITAAQLHECGMSRTAIATDRARGQLVPVFRGVDRVGGSSTSARQMLDAALLVLPERSGAARTTALAVHGVVDQVPPVPAVIVPYGRSVRLEMPNGDGARGDHVRIHRSRSLDGSDIEVVRGTRTTGVARSLLESGSALPAGRWRDLAATAIRMNLTTVPVLLDRLEELGRIPGAATMRRELGGLPADLGRARSLPEADLPAHFAAAGLPVPVLNYEILDESGVLLDEVDAALPDWKLGYELDSREWHTLPSQVLKDEVKDLRLGARGWVIHRIPVALLRQPRYLRRLLAQTYAAAVARTTA